MSEETRKLTREDVRRIVSTEYRIASHGERGILLPYFCEKRQEWQAKHMVRLDPNS